MRARSRDVSYSAPTEARIFAGARRRRPTGSASAGPSPDADRRGVGGGRRRARPRTVVKDKDDPWANVGRNDPCPCGSGKKYKKCHGANA